MDKEFSIAEARHSLAALVHQLDHQPKIQLTRRGKPVAVLLSQREFERLSSPRARFWDAYQGLLASSDVASLGIEPDLFRKARDGSAGRETGW